jgi:hypothetical protein
VVRLLLDAGASHDHVNRSGATPLATCIHRGCSSATRALLQDGADPAQVTMTGRTVDEIVQMESYWPRGRLGTAGVRALLVGQSHGCLEDLAQLPSSEIATMEQSSVWVSPDGQHGASLAGGMVLVLWDLTEEPLVVRAVDLDNSLSPALAISADGSIIASTTWGHGIRILDNDLSEIETVSTVHTVESPSWSPSAEHLAFLSMDTFGVPHQEVVRWCRSTGSFERSGRAGYMAWATASRDDRVVVSWSDDSAFCLDLASEWDAGHNDPPRRRDLWLGDPGLDPGIDYVCDVDADERWCYALAGGIETNPAAGWLGTVACYDLDADALAAPRWFWHLDTLNLPPDSITPAPEVPSHQAGVVRIVDGSTLAVGAGKLVLWLSRETGRPVGWARTRSSVISLASSERGELLVGTVAGLERLPAPAHPV